MQHGMQAGPVRDAHPAWDPSVPRGQQPAGARRESRTGPVRCGIRDPRGNRLGVLAGLCKRKLLQAARLEPPLPLFKVEGFHLFSPQLFVRYKVCNALVQ